MFPDPEVFLLITIGTKIIIIIINAFRETDEEATNPTRHCPYVEPHSCAAAIKDNASICSKFHP